MLITSAQRDGSSSFTLPQPSPFTHRSFKHISAFINSRARRDNKGLGERERAAARDRSPDNCAQLGDYLFHRRARALMRSLDIDRLVVGSGGAVCVPADLARAAACSPQGTPRTPALCCAARRARRKVDSPLVGGRALVRLPPLVPCCELMFRTRLERAACLVEPAGQFG
jgi:hypothetical protein